VVVTCTAWFEIKRHCIWPSKFIYFYDSPINNDCVLNDITRLALVKETRNFICVAGEMEHLSYKVLRLMDVQGYKNEQLVLCVSISGHIVTYTFICLHAGFLSTSQLHA